MGGIAKLRHRVLLCSQDDVVINGDMQIKRDGVLATWASIDAKAGSMFSPTGVAIKESRNRRTHVVHIRYRHDINVSGMAWLYEERLQSPPRWFKVLAVDQTEMKGSPYFKFDCRLVERGDELASPGEGHSSGLAQPMPKGVRL